MRAPSLDASVHPCAALIGQTPVMAALRAQIEHLATFDTVDNPHVPTVLLHGETGSGKGLTARVMHASGARAHGPCIEVNCAAIPETLLEAELFGFEAGAFTDARRAKSGLFEAASGGTLFLDEVDALPLPLQSKLLTALEAKQVRRLGAVAARPVDVKLIAATKEDLRQHVAHGRFRADLYYRLAVVVLVMPPLRQRPQDIVLLAQHFLQQYTAVHGVALKRLHSNAEAWLTAQPWPGNVRELSHLVERATLLRPETLLEAAMLEALALPPMHPASPQEATSPSAVSSSQDEITCIRQALYRTGGNVAGAARLLGMTRNTLRYRMRRHGITRPSWETLSPPMIPVAESPRRQESAGQPDAVPHEGTEPSSTWEQKPVAVLALELTFAAAERDVSTSAPWTEAARWEREIVEQVGGFGGVFVQRSASLLTAVFGIPRTLEQLPQRAVQAALAIRRQVAETKASAERPPVPELRLAIHLGPVLVDVTAPDPAARLLAVGDTLAMPGRLLGHARAGELLVSRPVARQVEAICEIQERHVALDAEPSDCGAVYAVLGRRPEVSPPQELAAQAPSRLVGRRRELAVLHELLAQARAGRGQVVFLSGEAGIGKSRLLLEFRRALANTAEAVTWLEGHCRAFGQTTPLLPIVDQLRTNFRITDTDQEAAIIAKVEAGMRRMGELEPHIPAIRYLLAVHPGDAELLAMEPAARRKRLTDAVLALTLRGAQLRPLILVYEDLQWSDTSTAELLGALMDLVAGVPLLMIQTHRVGYTPPFGRRSFYTTLCLQNLSHTDTRALASSLLGTETLPEALIPLLREQTEGVPLYLEEIIKTLLDTGALRPENNGYRLALRQADIRVPATLRELILARLDRLGMESKRLVQIASTIGRRFPGRLLEHIADAPDQLHERLTELQALEMLHLRTLSPEPIYVFKHAMLREVAYHSLLLRQRQELHRTVGQTIEALYAERLAEHYEELAHHFTQGEVWSKALEYSVLAGDRAAEAFASTEAEAHYRRALQAAAQGTQPAEPVVVARLHAKLADLLEAHGDYEAAVASYQHALACVRPGQDRRTEVELLVGLSGAYNSAHREEPAVATSEHALALARQLDDRASLAMCLLRRAAIRSVARGQIVEATLEAEEALQLARDMGDSRTLTHVLFFLGGLLQWRADFNRSLTYLRQGVELAEQTHEVLKARFAFFKFGHAAASMGNYEDALQWYRRLGDYAKAAGDAFRMALVPNLFGGIHLELFDFDEALRLNLESDELARQLYPWPEPRGHALVKAGLASLYRQEHSRADTYFRRAEALLEDDLWMRWRWHIVLLRARGELALRAGRHHEAWTHATQSLQLATQSDSRKHMVRAQLLQGDILAATERLHEAARLLDATVKVAEHLQLPGDAWLGSAALGKALLRLGRDQEAEMRFLQAAQTIEVIVAGLRTSRLRRSFLAAPPVLEVYEALGHRPPSALP